MGLFVGGGCHCAGSVAEALRACCCGARRVCSGGVVPGLCLLRVSIMCCECQSCVAGVVRSALRDAAHDCPVSPCPRVVCQISEASKELSKAMRRSGGSDRFQEMYAEGLLRQKHRLAAVSASLLPSRCCRGGRRRRR